MARRMDKEGVPRDSTSKNQGSFKDYVKLEKEIREKALKREEEILKAQQEVAQTQKEIQKTRRSMPQQPPPTPRGPQPRGNTFYLKPASVGDGAMIFIFLSLVIWVLDRDFLGIFGSVYAGFNFDLLGTLQTDWIAIVSGGLMLTFLGFSIFFDILKNQRTWIISFFVVIFLIRFPVNSLIGGSLSFSNIGSIVFLLVILVGTLVVLRGRVQGAESYWSFLLMIFVLNYFWINWAWTNSIRAMFHMAFIVLFVLLYVKPKEEEQTGPATWHILMIAFIILDFWVYDLISDYTLFGFFPVLVMFTLLYTGMRSESPGPKRVLAVFVIVVILVLSLNAYSLPTEEGNVQFLAKQSVENIDTLAKLRANFIQLALGFVEGRLDIATGGLYRGSVERNQYESLGVYFRDIRAAQPRFFTDEPITVWGSIRGKTYQDAVIVNFTCFRWVEENRLEFPKVVPDKIFPVFELEETDVECVYRQLNEDERDGEPVRDFIPFDHGTHKVTFSAIYNFDTNAYKKAYFMESDRYRSLIREDIDPLRQFGITERNPKSVFTNGPVEIGMDVDELTVVDEAREIKPSIFISLTNRQQIQDKDRKIVSQWEGNIKKIHDLILLTPPGITIERPEEDCTPIPFEPYDQSMCDTSCGERHQSCQEACADGGSYCSSQCEDKSRTCREECNFLFSGEALGGSYNGYALDTSSELFQGEGLYKNIDRYRTFGCRFLAEREALLDDTPITTRNFRVRARYDYLLENHIQVRVERPKVDTTPTPLRNAVGLNSGAYDASLFPTEQDKELAQFLRGITINNKNSEAGIHEGELTEIILAAARKHDVDYFFLKSIIQRESAFRRNTPAGDGGKSIGLMQIQIPIAKAEESPLNPGCFPSSASDSEVREGLQDPVRNIDCGAKFLRKLMDWQQSNDYKQTLANTAAGYNGGWTYMQYSTDSGREKETRWENSNNQGSAYNNIRNYVNSVVSNFNRQMQQLAQKLILDGKIKMEVSGKSISWTVEGDFEEKFSLSSYRVLRDRNVEDNGVVCQHKVTGASSYSCADENKKLDPNSRYTYRVEVFFEADGVTRSKVTDVRQEVPEASKGGGGSETVPTISVSGDTCVVQGDEDEDIFQDGEGYCDGSGGAWNCNTPQGMTYEDCSAGCEMTGGKAKCRTDTGAFDDTTTFA